MSSKWYLNIGVKLPGDLRERSDDIDDHTEQLKEHIRIWYVANQTDLSLMQLVNFRL